MTGALVNAPPHADAVVVSGRMDRPGRRGMPS